MNKDQDLEKLSKSTKSTESKVKGDSSSNQKAPQENASSASSSITSDSVTMKGAPSTPRKELHTPPLESPADSPRPPSKDEVSGRPTREGLVDSPRRAQFPFGVPPSPPRFVQLESMMRAVHALENMALAHEIAVDNDFRLEKRVLPENSAERQVEETMRRAFWDVLDEKLRAEPPDYSHALVLVDEIRQTLLSLLPEQQRAAATSVMAALDPERVREHIAGGTFDLRAVANFVLDMMAKMCAPARDEQVAALRQIHEIVPLFKEVYAVLDLMKLDMANFHIQQARPMIQMHSREYERDKFNLLLQEQRANGVDGLQHTRRWLAAACEQVLQANGSALDAASREMSPAPAGGASSSVSSPKDTADTPPSPRSPRSSHSIVLNAAYLRLLDDSWDYESDQCPETLMLDARRFEAVREQLSRSLLLSCMLFLTASVAPQAFAADAGASAGTAASASSRAAPIPAMAAGHAPLRTAHLPSNSTGRSDEQRASSSAQLPFKAQLKQELSVLLKELNTRDWPKEIDGLAEHIVVRVSARLSAQSGQTSKPFDESKADLLRSQLRACISVEHPVHALLKKRMKEFVRELLVSSQSSRVRIASSSQGARGSTPDKSQPAVSTSSGSSAASSTAYQQPPQQSLAAASSGTPSQSPRPAVAELQLPAGFSALEEELLASVAQLVRLVVHNRAVYVEHYGAIVEEELARLRDRPNAQPAST